MLTIEFTPFAKRLGALGLILAGIGCASSESAGNLSEPKPAPVGPSQSAETVRAYVLTEKPADGGGKKVDLYAFELRGVLPGPDASGNAQPVPATLFPADAPPSQRQSHLILEHDGQLGRVPMANADVLLHVTDDAPGFERELKALAEIKSLLAEDAAPSAKASPPNLRPLLNPRLLEALKARRALERELIAAQAQAEASPNSQAAQARVDALEQRLANDDALARVSAALSAATRGRKR